MSLTEAIESYLTLNCNYESTVVNQILAIVLYVPYAMIIIFWAVSWITKEIIWLVMSFSLFLDTLLNFFLTGLFLDPAPRPSCGGSSAYPSYLTEHWAFVVMFLFLARHLYNLSMSIPIVIMLVSGYLLTWIAAVRLGYTNYEQALSGAVVGHVFAALIFTIMHFIIEYAIKRHHSSFSWLMVHYKDSYYKKYHIVEDQTKQ